MSFVHALKASQTFNRTRWVSARQTLQVVSLYRPRNCMTYRRYIESSISRESSKLSIDMRDQLVLMLNPPWLITCGSLV
jgi:Holliday junction resolvase RusA-like endonuclease